MTTSDERIHKLLKKKGLPESSLEKAHEIDEEFRKQHRNLRIKDLSVKAKNSVMKKIDRLKETPNQFLGFFTHGIHDRRYCAVCDHLFKGGEFNDIRINKLGDPRELHYPYYSCIGCSARICLVCEIVLDVSQCPRCGKPMVVMPGFDGNNVEPALVRELWRMHGFDIDTFRKGKKSS